MSKEEIQANFKSLREALDNCDGIFVMVDARDPQAFHCPWIVEEMKARKLPRLSAMVKVDLVPRVSAKNWVASLDPGLWTVGADLTKPEAAGAIVKKLIRDYGEGAKRMVCIGAPGTGKTTLCKIVGAPLIDTPGWLWPKNNISLALTGAYPWRGTNQSLALAFLSRVENGGFATLGITPELMLEAYAKKNGVAYEEAGNHLVARLRSYDLKWCAFSPIPKDDSFLWKRQWRVLLESCHHITEGWIRITPGEGVEKDEEILQ
ncbi:hypothetical protein TRFO_14345 [Tritrichomonas foetus]|uniref:Uncharacterized protein n=1 Tax=Tritrichomonas foetus TaxID=1144522 RepID=A0A1J4KVB2_9EUKA|nr:hypothetical protein TRFO_14345 [Tritrichomonas foetus]|eukprot:OHT15171.1 hypothetical protein TRFO_14345 [Tritrichomonas foetus]